ncbi:MAG: DsbA family protein [Xanthobacteraceae bacterium]|nr:DsbA family protein [Xanthobacteraceae bacterium]
MPANLDFYFDFISPFGYLASLRVDDLAQKYGRDCRWHSMLLGISVLKVMGLPPLTQIPLKGEYLGVDLKRYLRRHKLTLARSREMGPSNPIAAGRAFHWIDARDPALAKSAAKAILNAYWQQGTDIGSVEAVVTIVEGAGADARALRAGFASGEADRLLRAAVDRSLALGVFGSPFFMIDGEPFFGLEKMELVEEWLASGGW